MINIAKKAILLLSTLLVSSVILLSFQSITYASDLKTGSCGTDATWSMDDSGTLTIDGTGNITSSPWTSYSDEIHKIVIGDGITGMNSSQFSGLSMVTSVKIGNGITYIPRTAFSNLSMLQELEIGDNVESIGRQAFYSCGKLKNVIIPDSVKTIDVAAFIFCNIDNISIGSHVERIGDHAFKGGTFDTIILPAAVSTLGIEPFPVSTNIIVSDDNEIVFTKEDSLCIKSDDGEITLVQVFNAKDNADYSVPSGITKIGEWAFGENIHFNQVTIANDVKSIGSYCLGNSSANHIITGDTVKTISSNGLIGFGDISLGEGLETIGESAFWGDVTSLTLPNSIKYIGNAAFSECRSLTDIYVPKKTPPSTSNSIFASESSRYGDELYIHVPEGSTGYDDEPWNAGTVVYDLPEYYREGKCGDSISWSIDYEGNLEIKGIGNMHNYGYKSAPWYSYRSIIQTVIINEGVTSVGAGAFEDCINLVNINLPNSVKAIGSSAFENCKSLKSVELPTAINGIESRLFIGCSALETIEIPVSVTSISYDVFNGCTSLKDIYVPDNVSIVDDAAFNYCGAKLHIKKGSPIDKFVSDREITFEYTCLYGHVWNEEYTIDNEPTCTEEGLGSIHCSVCGEVKEDSECSIDPLGHDIVGRHQIKEVTCTEDGIDELWCSRCGATGITEVVPAFGHFYSDWVITQEATCDAPGSREKICPYCDDVIIEEIPALGHKWADEYTVDKAPTCTEEGIESIHCTACGEIKEGSEQAIPVTDHNYSDWTVIKEATCTEDGTKEKVCADCGDRVAESIPATGHHWNDSYTVDREPTCAEEGIESIHCAICGEIREGSERAIAKTTDHHYGDWTIVKEATYTETGIRERICEICGDKEIEEIPALVRTPISEASITKISAKTYTGKALTQSPVIVFNDETLVAGTDYTLKYKNNKNVGTATVTITGKGDYKGSVSKTFAINPKGATIVKPAAAKKAITIKWKKQTAKMSSARITGYQVQYSTDKTFKKSVKSASVKGYTKVSSKITKLKAKTTYYVRVRTYMKVGSKTYYSPWSTIKSVKTK